MSDTKPQSGELRQLRRGRKFRKVMREFSAGTLHSSDGTKVTDKDQAVAIAASEQRAQHKRWWGRG